MHLSRGPAESEVGVLASALVHHHLIVVRAMVDTVGSPHHPVPALDIGHRELVLADDELGRLVSGVQGDVEELLGERSALRLRQSFAGDVSSDSLLHSAASFRRC